MLLAELHHPQPEPTTIYEDNRATIIIAEGNVSSAGRAKHIDVRYKHAAESVRNGICILQYIASAWNFADIMTKALANTKFRSVRDLCLNPATRPPEAVSSPTTHSETACFFLHLDTTDSPW